MNQELIRFEDVSMEFKDKGQSFKALDGISFSINSGDVLGIIGESGSGKSTIAKLLSGLHKPSQGKIFFEDKEISHLSRKDKKWLHTQVQMVFQNAQGSFNPRRTIGHSIEETVCQLCAHTKEEARKKVGELLADVGLKEEYSRKYPHEMSGGECQRAAIARAMAVHPGLLICDEATSALDVSAQAKIIDLLMHLRKKRHIHLIFISHDLPLVSTITNKVLIMDKGKIVEEGLTKDVIFHPKTEYTKKLLDAVL